MESNRTLKNKLRKEKKELAAIKDSSTSTTAASPNTSSSCTPVDVNDKSTDNKRKIDKVTTTNHNTTNTISSSEQSTTPLKKGFRESKKAKCVELVDDIDYKYKKTDFLYTKLKKADGGQLFNCMRCLVEKKSRNMITFIATEKVICNGCYGFLLQGHKKNASADGTADGTAITTTSTTAATTDAVASSVTN